MSKALWLILILHSKGADSLAKSTHLNAGEVVLKKLYIEIATYRALTAITSL